MTTGERDTEQQFLKVICWAEKQFSYNNNSEIGKPINCAAELIISKAKAELAERGAEIARLREELKQYLNEATK